METHPLHASWLGIQTKLVQAIREWPERKEAWMDFPERPPLCRCDKLHKDKIESILVEIRRFFILLSREIGDTSLQERASRNLTSIERILNDKLEFVGPSLRTIAYWDFPSRPTIREILKDTLMITQALPFAVKTQVVEKEIAAGIRFKGLPKDTDSEKLLENSPGWDRLTKIQKDYGLMAWAHNLTTTEIGKRMGVHRKTVDEALTAAKNKMGHAREMAPQRANNLLPATSLVPRTPPSSFLKSISIKK
jgi:hypothetical protein